MLINPGDIADGVLVSAIGAMGRIVLRPRMTRRTSTDIAIARSFDAVALTREGLPGGKLELQWLSQAEVRRLQVALESDEVQGALQALLAARLTKAPEAEVRKGREAVRLALSKAPARDRVPESGHGPDEAEPAASRYAEQLSEYYDEKICALVARLEGSVDPEKLDRIRQDAFSTRIVALLAELVAALAHPERGGQAEADFLDRYRRQVRERHGKLEPPDFQRRRRVPADRVYVNTLVTEWPLHVQPPRQSRVHRIGPGTRPLPSHLVVSALEPPPRRFHMPTHVRGPSTAVRVMDLADRLYRTVLLGDPGGGKTTAANVLANFFAGDAARKVPFLVTLRNYAAAFPPERSVARHIERTLETLYQCPAPEGLVERLMLTGRAVVIFDGLDELLDTSRRRDVSDRVEQFCSAYPLAPVLVTSRLVGYDEGRLDDEQFSCYRLAEFGDAEVAEYARKWFTMQEGASVATGETEAKAFLADSAGAPDLRSNPLLLSLMCILYQGGGVLPPDRAGIYAKCAELLFGKWDEQRRIHQELRTSHLVEPAIRQLAWWLFSSANARAAVPEHELVAEVTAFLRERAYESEDEARVAATEFVEFCRGRMWVLSDAGTTADGETLYAFTHRTFLEYFTAARVAAVSDTPEDLARALAAHIEDGGWEIVAQLAIQLKDRSTDRGADRVYATLLELARPAEPGRALLEFIAKSARNARLSPPVVRSLTRAMLHFQLDQYGHDGTGTRTYPLRRLLDSSAYRQLIADEISGNVDGMVADPNPAAGAAALQLALEVGLLAVGDFWRRWSRGVAARHVAAIVDAATRSVALRTIALHAGVVSVEEALGMPGGFGALMGSTRALLTEWADPYPVSLCVKLALKRQDLDTARELAAIGDYLTRHPRTPWVRVRPSVRHPVLDHDQLWTGWYLPGETDRLGFAALICVNIELSGGVDLAARGQRRHAGGLGAVFHDYVSRRRLQIPLRLQDLPVPVEFRQVFRDWAEGRVDFVELPAE